MQSFTRESRFISRMLDRISYSRQMVTFRQKVHKKIEQGMNRKQLEMQQYSVVAGSKAEGLTIPLENDTDLMSIPMYVFCSEYPDLLCHRDYKIVFALDMTCTTPGYTFLRLVHFNDDLPLSDIFHECLAELSPEKYYLSSDMWKNHIRVRMGDNGNDGFVSTDQETHGPSVRFSILDTTETDLVYALECDCPDYLNSWITRNRSYQWPPVHVIWDVFNSQAHVVPVGFPESSTYFLEWRICFTEGEIKLVKSLNDCLTKVLILLKQIARSTLKPLCKDMTSYIMKNVVFWIAETHNYNIFTENNLLFVLQLALKFLKTCIETGNLSSYMIPERNLLANKLTDRQRLDLCMRIDSLIREGPQIVLNSSEMRKAVTMRYQYPREFEDFIRRRKEAELFALALNSYFLTNFLTQGIRLEQIIYILLTDDVLRDLFFRFAGAYVGL